MAGDGIIDLSAEADRRRALMQLASDIIEKADPIAAYLSNLEHERRLSAHTLRGYTHELEELRLLAKGRPLESLTAVDIRGAWQGVGAAPIPLPAPLIPAGNDDISTFDTPVKLMLDDAKSEVTRLIGINDDPTCRNTVIVLIVGGCDGTTYTDATLARPRHLTRGPDGALWFTNGGTFVNGVPTAGPCRIAALHASAARSRARGGARGMCARERRRRRARSLVR